MTAKVANSILERMREIGLFGKQAGVPRVHDLLAPISTIHRIPDHILQPAIQRGIAVHQLVEDFWNQKSPVPPDEYAGYMESFVKWMEAHKNEWLAWAAELPLYFKGDDSSASVRGTADLVTIRMVDDVPHMDIFDWKTSKRPNDLHRIQAAFYSMIAERMISGNIADYEPDTPEPPFESHVVYLAEDGSEPKVKKALPGDRRLAVALRRVHRYRWKRDYEYRKELEQRHQQELYDLPVESDEMDDDEVNF